MSKRIQRLICKNFINRIGVDVILKRFNHETQLDFFGEPIEGDILLPSGRIIKIVVNTDKRQVDETSIGGVPDNKGKEMLYFFCAGTEDVKTGDKIIYPPNTETEWIVYFIEPSYLNGQTIMNEVKCKRDARY
jgi:hypothetical protein